MAVLYITQISAWCRLCDRVQVMYAGRLVEPRACASSSTSRSILHASPPALDPGAAAERSELYTIPGCHRRVETDAGLRLRAALRVCHRPLSHHHAPARRIPPATTTPACASPRRNQFLTRISWRAEPQPNPTLIFDHRFHRFDLDKAIPRMTNGSNLNPMVGGLRFASALICAICGLHIPMVWEAVLEMLFGCAIADIVIQMLMEKEERIPSVFILPSVVKILFSASCSCFRSEIRGQPFLMSEPILELHDSRPISRLFRFVFDDRRHVKASTASRFRATGEVLGLWANPAAQIHARPHHPAARAHDRRTVFSKGATSRQLRRRGNRRAARSADGFSRPVRLAQPADDGVCRARRAPLGTPRLPPAKSQRAWLSSCSSSASRRISCKSIRMNFRGQRNALPSPDPGAAPAVIIATNPCRRSTSRSRPRF